MNEHPSPEFEKEIRETLGASGADPAFVHHLRVTLLERSKMKKQTRSFYRLAWGLAAAVLLIGLLVASPRAVEALKQLLGYIPGLGYMEQGNSLRILTAPVTLEKDGLKLTVTKGATDAERTILLAHLEGNPPDQENELNCITPSRLVLPDGTLLKEMGHEGGSTPSGSYYERYTFEAMPTGQLEATLEIPCVMSDSDFTDFALPLHFEVADEGQVMPLIELPTVSADTSSDVSVEGAPSTLEGFSIVLGDETPLPDGYVLSGSYEWTDPRFEAFSVHVRAVEILDANGQAVIFEPVDPGSFMDPALKKLPFAYQITGKDHAYPLTLTVNSIAADLPSGSTFQFDAGTDPQVGQVWDVDIDVPVDEHIIHVQTIKLTAGATPTQLGFTFSMTSDPSVLGARIDDIDPAITGNGAGGGGGGGGRAANNVFECSWAFEGYSPAGLKTFVVSNITLILNETSQATWQPSGQ
jgi:hypothetical protein